MVLGRKRDAWDGKERREQAMVLVVNDEPAACELLARMIATLDYRTVTATTEAAATAAIATELPRCVVLDLSSWSGRLSTAADTRAIEPGPGAPGQGDSRSRWARAGLRDPAGCCVAHRVH